jgi:hypothetical protein
MRLTLRILIASVQACVQGLDEILMHYRNDEAYGPGFREARNYLNGGIRILHSMLDQMIDNQHEA